MKRKYNMFQRKGNWWVECKGVELDLQVPSGGPDGLRRVVAAWRKKAEIDDLVRTMTDPAYSFEKQRKQCEANTLS